MSAIAKADFLERVRKSSFYITFVITIYIACLFVPGQDSSYYSLLINGYRGIYNSEWIGLTVALLTSFFLGLAGFYLIKDAIVRDEQSGVGQLIATTPMKNWEYIMGKALSNFLILLMLACSAILSGTLMFFIRGESTDYNLFAMINPFIIIVLPTLFAVSALALLFENIKWLKGGLGNVLYFILWLTGLIIPLEFSQNPSLVKYVPYTDFMSIELPTEKIAQQVQNMFNTRGDDISIIGEIGDQSITLFEWTGMPWTLDLLTSRGFVILVSFVLLIISSLLFKRFDLSKSNRSPLTVKKNLVVKSPLITTPKSDSKEQVVLSETPVKIGFSYLNIIKAELKIMLKGIAVWWYFAVIVLNLIAFFIPLEQAISSILPLTWFLPVFIWSSMGIRERKYKTAPIIFSCPHTLKYQFSAMILSGILVTALCSSGLFFRFLLVGHSQGLISLLSGTLFIPILALTLGTLSGTSRFFEAFYVLIWYMGPLNKFPYLDFVGASPESFDLGIPFVYFIIALILLSLSVYRRRKILD